MAVAQMETTGSDANKAQCSELQTISPRLLNLFAHGFQGRCFQFAAQINSRFVIQFFQQCPRGRNQPGASGQQDHAEQSDHRPLRSSINRWSACNSSASAIASASPRSTLRA